MVKTSRRDREGPSPIGEEALGRIAWILGDSSAAAGALAELRARASAGENVACYQCGDVLFVGPRQEAFHVSK
jgi:hypothetical protein